MLAPAQTVCSCQNTVSPGLFGLLLNRDPPSRAAGLSKEFPHTAANLVSFYRFLLLTSSVAPLLSCLKSLTADIVVWLLFEPCDVLLDPNLPVFFLPRILDKVVMFSWTPYSSTFIIFVVPFLLFLLQHPSLPCQTCYDECGTGDMDPAV